MVYLPDLLEEGMPRWRREVVLVLTWASALATTVVEPRAGLFTEPRGRLILRSSPAS